MSRAVPASFDLQSFRAAYAGGLDPRDVVAAVDARLAAYADPAVFIVRPTNVALQARAAELAGLSLDDRARLPLFGVPFVVKDNIDVAGLPTTAGCPEFAYVPEVSATVVSRLEAAGAMLIGKANLDQFATGLVGVRSPYGVPRNSFDAELIPGGSSSGSATSVAAGLASFSLGTDTAGSGRVPAGLNNLVGLKPTPGLVSNSGVVPACRTLDCVSIFAMTVDDAWSVLEVTAGFDAADPYSRSIPLRPWPSIPSGVRLGVPGAAERHFFGDTAGAVAFEAALAALAADGHQLVEVDLEPFLQVARLLYEGPWVAERYAAIRDFIEARPDALYPTTRAIIEPAKGRGAVEAFEATYRLADLRRATEPVWSSIDALVVPTVPRAWTVKEVEADPIATNSALGTYTNFVNLLGLSALAVPERIRQDGRPSGVTFIAPGGRDGFLAGLGRAVEARSGLPLGATGLARPTPSAATNPSGELMPLAIFGAHMTGLPLNGQLVGFGAVFLSEIETAPIYKLVALSGPPPARPGLLRVGEGGTSIAGELWALPYDGLGRLLTVIPSPLGLGTIALADGTSVKGFLCEAFATQGANDISKSGGWRAHLTGAGYRELSMA